MTDLSARYESERNAALVVSRLVNSGAEPLRTEEDKGHLGRRGRGTRQGGGRSPGASKAGSSHEQAPNGQFLSLPNTPRGPHLWAVADDHDSVLRSGTLSLDISLHCPALCTGEVACPWIYDILS